MKEIYKRQIKVASMEKMCFSHMQEMRIISSTIAKKIVLAKEVTRSPRNQLQWTSDDGSGDCISENI